MSLRAPALLRASSAVNAPHPLRERGWAAGEGGGAARRRQGRGRIDRAIPGVPVTAVTSMWSGFEVVDAVLGDFVDVIRPKGGVFDRSRPALDLFAVL